MSKEDFSEASFLGTIKAMPNLDFSLIGISEASVSETAKSLLPEEFDASKNIDLLPVVFNLAVVNKFNKNGDGVDAKSAVASVKNFANKPINCEHKKDKIVGHILSATLGLEEDSFDGHVDLESFAEETRPFYIKASGVIYRHIFPKLCSVIIDASNKESENYESLSTSWEIGFKNHKIIKNSKSLLVTDGEEVKEEEEAKKLRKLLKANGGKGVDKEGNSIHRLITNEFLPLGAGLTYNPAAEVKGVFTIPDDKEEDLNQEEGQSSEIFNNFIIKNSLTQDMTVRIKNFKENLNMTKEQFDQFLQKIETSAASVLKEEGQAKSIGLIMADALKDFSKEWEDKVVAEQQAASKAKEDLQTLQASFEEVKTELDKVKQEAAAKAAAELFNNRMNFVEATYSFSEEELKFVINELKTIEASDEAFEGFKTKLGTLFSHKSKASIKEKEEEIQNTIEQEVQRRLQESKQGESNASTKEGEGEEGLENLESNASTVPNNSGEASVKENLLEKLKKNFSVEVTL